MSKITTSQTIGPFSHEAWKWATDATAAGHALAGDAGVSIGGVILDGDGNPVNDAQIEAWSPHAAAAEAAVAGIALPGFRRVPSGADGQFSLRVPMPQSLDGEPLLYVTVFARGLVLHQFSAVFLEDDPALARSAILAQVPAARRATLLARKTGDGRYHWAIRMQGPDETVFFDYA